MTENVLKKLDEHIQCSICLDTYKNPKVLQCHHVYCRSCLLKILIGRLGIPLTYLECPNCRVRTHLPSGDVDELQSAFHMSGVLDIRNEIGKVEDFTSLKLLTTSLEEPASDFAKPSVCFCSDHGQEEVKLYCDFCAVTICFLCAINGGKHHRHQYSILSEAYMKYEKDIEASVTSLDDGVKGIAKLLDEIDAGSISIREREEALKKDIGDKFRELHDILNMRQTGLVGNMQGMTHRKLKVLSTNRDELETLQTKALRCQSVARVNLTSKNEAAVLKMKTEIAEQVEEVSSTLLLPHGLTFDMKTAGLVFKSSPELSEVCQKFGEFITSGSPNPLSCYITGSCDVAEVGEKALIWLHIVDSSGEPCSEDAPCSCTCDVMTKELEVCATSSYPGNVERVGISEYELSYIPTNCGSYEINVKVNGGHIKGSPFPILVTENRSKMGVPALKDVNGLGIAICPGSQEVVVTNICVSIYDCNGEHVFSFGKPGFRQGDLNKPYGLAIDDNGDIVVADHFNGRVQKFTMKGEFIASAGSTRIGLLKFDHPYDIAFNPNNKKLYVIDNTCVQILKPDLSYTRCFGRPGQRKGEFSTPHGIACDNFGNVYVADSGNHRIQVFTSGGKFLKLFGKHGSREGELGFPVALAIGNTGVLYVSENENHRVSVFTISGKFLSFLKNKTDSTVCRFVSPHGIAIDCNGVSYICDDKCIVKV